MVCCGGTKGRSVYALSMNQAERRFVKTVWGYYDRHGRRSLPWRLTKNPYHILVSEIMLQQTQVDRVIPKYRDFLKVFPTAEILARASLGDVLRTWQGLGYNRRAKMLHETAKQITTKFGGKFPHNKSQLLELPGIGPYTAGAIMAFACNTPTVLIETNIRSVYIHHFFNDSTDVHDTELLKIIERTLDTEKSRKWYYALMDYGSYIKKTYGNPNKRSKQYVSQTVFKGSDRQMRGAILRYLIKNTCTRKQLHTKLGFEDVRVDAQLVKLESEGLIQKQGRVYALPT